MIDALVLAAGYGTRMGQVKALTTIDGEPFLSRIIGRLRQAGLDRPIVVLGHESDSVLEAIDLSACRVVTNPDPGRGLSSSLLLGIQAVDARASGVLVLHADMPMVASETTRAVAETAEMGAHLAAPLYHGKRGFPVYLSRTSFSELHDSLDGDTGARDYIARHSDDLVLVDVDDPGCILDIDTPEDLAHVRRSSRCATSA
ncbi:MAG: nucleotidyltransferase family protein [Candidatus Bipolaricaulia bacterium]